MPRSRTRRAAFTLIEIVISMVIVSVMLVSVLGTLGASHAMQFKGAQQSDALLLAQDLMTEILRQPYEDPDGPPVMGRELGEAEGSRANWDDVDDYIAWASTPLPRYKNNAQILWAKGYQRTAKVWWVEPDDLSGASPVETGLKGIEVRVLYGGRTLVRLFAVRSAAGGGGGAD